MSNKISHITITITGIICNAIEDQYFNLPSTEAKEAIETATEIKSWMNKSTENNTILLAVDKFHLDMFKT